MYRMHKIVCSSARKKEDTAPPDHSSACDSGDPVVLWEQQSLQDVRDVVLWLQAKPLHFRGKEIRVENGRDSGFRRGRIP